MSQKMLKWASGGYSQNSREVGNFSAHSQLGRGTRRSGGQTRLKRAANKVLRNEAKVLLQDLIADAKIIREEKLEMEAFLRGDITHLSEEQMDRVDYWTNLAIQDSWLHMEEGEMWEERDRWEEIDRYEAMTRAEEEALWYEEMDSRYRDIEYEQELRRDRLDMQYSQDPPTEKMKSQEAQAIDGTNQSDAEFFASVCLSLTTREGKVRQVSFMVSVFLIGEIVETQIFSSQEKATKWIEKQKRVSDHMHLCDYHITQKPMDPE